MSVTTLDGVLSADEVIPGDLAGLEEAANRLLVQSRTYDAFAMDLAQMGRTVEWEGPAGDGFRGAMAQVPDAFAAAADAHERAARAVIGYSEDLAAARRQVAGAIDLWETGTRLSMRARTDFDRVESAKPGSSSLLQEPPALFTDPGEPLRVDALSRRELADPSG